MSDVALLTNTPTPPRRSPSDQLVFNTVRIECEDSVGRKATGTGFYFAFAKENERNVPAIITNKHVIEGAVRGSLVLHLREADGSPSIRSQRFDIDNFGKGWIPHPDPSVDLCMMPIAGLLTHADSVGHTIGCLPLDVSLLPSESEFAQLTPLEDVLMIGYPSGIWDSHNNMPILRRGVTATSPAFDYEGRKEFMIDAACFPGSSGSPVFLYNTGAYHTSDGNFTLGIRIKLLGILYAGPQHTVTGELQMFTLPTVQIAPVSRIPTNLGLVIKSTRLFDFEEVCRKMVAQEKQQTPPTALAG